MFLSLGFNCAHQDDISRRNVFLKEGECFDKLQTRTRICLDSVYNDSRCPSDLVCVWEGDALAAFTLANNDLLRRFYLHVNTNFQNDTVIGGISVKLLKITPYPNSNHPINRAEYKVEISLEEH